MQQVSSTRAAQSDADQPVFGAGTAHRVPVAAAGASVGAEERLLLLSTAAATSKDRRLALIVVVTSLIAFVASVPFAQVPQAPLPAFIPFYQSALVINDIVTAVLLFGQFSILRSKALLVLAGAYLFTACMTFAHALSFPGLFSPGGLLGAGPQTTAWLYMFWHSGFPLLAIAYVELKKSRSDRLPAAVPGQLGIVLCVVAALAVACGFVLLATAGKVLLPTIMQGHGYTPLMPAVAGSVCVLSVVAAGTVWLRGSHSVLDLWLAVAMCTLSLDIALSAALNAGRFDLGFYAGRIYGLLATSVVLVVLLLESNRLYGQLVETHRSDRAKAAELRRLSTLDPLTRVANRRAFETAIDEEWRRSVRSGTSLCLLMIDVDHFKRFNDRYGHVAGDQCLRAVAEVLAGNARRAGELAARYGGEEFAVLLPQTDTEEALLLAERICGEVRALDIPHEDSTAAKRVTISVGLANRLMLATHRGSEERGGQNNGQRPTWTLLVEHADSALYAAKAAGRDRVAVACVDPEELASTLQRAG